MPPNLNKRDDEQVHVCEMCGDEGYKHCLLTCSSCGGLQHMYCMPEVILKAPKQWQCYVCQKKTQDLLAGKDVSRSLDEIHVCPAKFCSWIGKFMIHHEGFMDVKCLLKAHPPPTIKKKILRMSIKLPEEIQLTMVARTGLGLDLFPTSTTKGDIGLFFFCGEDLGCTRYLQILELLEANDCVLRSLMNGMELIVLSSKLLPSGSQCWLGRPFMWAVLRSLRRYKNISEINAIVVHHDPVLDNGSSSRVGTPPLPLLPPPPPSAMSNSVPTSAMKYGVPPGFEPSTSAMTYGVPPGFESSAAAMKNDVPPPPGFANVKMERII